MAKLTKKVFTANGKVGDLVFKERDGETYISQAASSEYKYKDLIAHKIITDQFGFSSKFCAAINKIKVFKELWTKIAVKKGGAFNCMNSVNNKKLRKGVIYNDLSLVPDSELFQIDLISYELMNYNLKVIFDHLPALAGVDNAFPTVISLQGVMYLSNPINKDEEPISFIPLVSKDEDTITNSEMEFNICLTNQQRTKINLFSEYQILLNLIIKDIQGNVKHISQNVVLV